MAWKKISATTFTASAAGTGGADKFFEVAVDYDDSTLSVTSVKIRFRANRTNYQDSSFADNGYYLLVNPGASSEKLYTLKASGKKWSEAVTTEMTISKSSSATSFTIPAFWICCTGTPTPNLAARTIVYKDESTGKAVTYNVYDLFKSDGIRKAYATRASNGTLTHVAAGGSPTCSITQDKGTNTVKIYCKTGRTVTNNGYSSNGSILWYTTDGSDPTLATSNSRTSVDLGTTSEYEYTKEITISSSSKNGTKIKAFVISYFKHNTTYTSTQTHTVKYYSIGGKPNVEINDLGNNKFNIACTASNINGWNNKLKSSTLYYTTNGKPPVTGTPYTDTTVVSLTIDSNNGSINYTTTQREITAKTRVRAVIGCMFDCGDINTNSDDESITYYAAPTLTGTKPTIEHTKSRLTIKEDWTFNWDGVATQANNDSPIVGYLVRVYMDGQSIQIFNKDSIELTIDGGSALGTARYYYDRVNSTVDNSTEMVFRTDKHTSIVPGKKIILGVTPYAKNGAGTKLYGSEAFSQEYPVLNAGIVQVKVGSQFVEGQVYVKVGTEWKEAETVNIKTSSSWVESQ